MRFLGYVICVHCAGIQFVIRAKNINSGEQLTRDQNQPSFNQ